MDQLRVILTIGEISSEQCADVRRAVFDDGFMPSVAQFKFDQQSDPHNDALRTHFEDDEALLSLLGGLPNNDFVGRQEIVDDYVINKLSEILRALGAQDLPHAAISDDVWMLKGEGHASLLFAALDIVAPAYVSWVVYPTGTSEYAGVSG